jgi:hypothetical protein
MVWLEWVDNLMLFNNILVVKISPTIPFHSIVDVLFTFEKTKMKKREGKISEKWESHIRHTS